MSACEAEIHAFFMADHPGAEVLDATTTTDGAR
jgi:hypothetical protein